jgi:hypothetical protein
MKNQKYHFTNSHHKLGIQIPSIASSSVYLPRNVCYYMCASNTWRYLIFDNPLAVRQRCPTDLLHARSSCRQLCTQHRFPCNFSGQCFLSDYFSVFGDISCAPHPTQLGLSCSATQLNSEYIEWILNEILQRVLTFFVRDCRSVLKFIVVNYSVWHLTSND